MNSKEAKKRVLSYYLLDRSFPYAATEYTGYGGYIADVATIDDNLFLTEIEIKLHRDDLMSELMAIKAVQDSETLFNNRYINKFGKHRDYLQGSKYQYYKYSRPNKFYFATLKQFQELVLEYIKDTPYGLLLLDTHPWSSSAEVIQKAKYIHKEPLKQADISSLMRKCCLENLTLREKLC